MTTVTIRLLERFPDPAWNAYVDRHAAGSFFHLSEWGAIYLALGWTEPHFLIAERGQETVGVMPLATVRWGIGRSAMVSMPYCVLAGAIADDESIQRQLEHAAIEQGRRCGARFLEVRQSVSPNPGWGDHKGFASFSRELAANDADNRKALPKRRRAMIRKGEAAGLAVCSDIDLQKFYALYALSMRNLGTPLYGWRLFELLWHHFESRVGLLAATDANEPVAAVMSFYYKGRVMPYYTGAMPRARQLAGSDFLYWALMCDAVKRGCRIFDFGRSVVGTGSADLKKNWGFEAVPLSYQFVALDGSAVAPLDPDSPLNSFARRAWSRLPLPLANWLGPLVSRRLY
jgi:FemAB-related protein (PEP-CTERM system-associated)